MWDVTAVDGGARQAWTLCCFQFGLKGAIHEQFAGVKSTAGRAAVYDRECIYVFVGINVCVSPYVCHSAALPDTDVVTTKRALDIYQPHQIGPKEAGVVLAGGRQPAVIAGRATRRPHADSNNSNNTG